MVTSGTTPHVPTPRQHAIGVTLAILVAIIWVLSSEMVQRVFQDPNVEEKGYKKPYFVTYVSLSAFVLCLFGFLRPSWRAALHSPPAPATGKHTYVELGTIPSLPPAQSVGAAVSVSHDEAVALSRFPEEEVLEEEVEVPHEQKHTVFNAQQVFGIALAIAPFFFISDWVFTVGLSKTSVASSSTISTLTALFTLLIGACMKVERFSQIKLFAAFTTIAGVALISAYDVRDHGVSSLVGDLISILSAFIYSLYTTVLKYKSGPPGALDVAMLFSFIGVAIMFGALPGFFVLNVTGWEPFELPSKNAAGLLFVNSVIGSVLADYLWAKSIVLTTPMIGTLALSLSVPISVIWDYLFNGVSFSLPYMFGVTMVFSGFILVNVDEMRERWRNTESVRNHADSDG